MCRSPAVGGAYGPTIAGNNGASRSGGNNRLNRDHQAFGQNLAGFGIGVVGHAGLFVDGAANAVSTQIANHGETAAPHFAFDHATNLEYPESGAGHQHGFGKGPLGTRNQEPALRGNFAHRNSLGGVGHETIFLDGDVELDQVSGFDLALSGNTMHRFVVQADAIHSGKLIDQLRSGLRALLPHDRGAHFIKFSSSDAGTHRPLHGFQHAAHNGARGPHAGEVVRTGDGHVFSLSHGRR